MSYEDPQSYSQQMAVFTHNHNLYKSTFTRKWYSICYDENMHVKY